MFSFHSKGKTQPVSKKELQKQLDKLEDEISDAHKQVVDLESQRAIIKDKLKKLGA